MSGKLVSSSWVLFLFSMDDQITGISRFCLYFAAIPSRDVTALITKFIDDAIIPTAYEDATDISLKSISIKAHNLFNGKDGQTCKSTKNIELTHPISFGSVGPFQISSFSSASQLSHDILLHFT